jgi:hypothetical protein
MKKLVLSLLLLTLAFGNISIAQDTLPHFSLRDVGKNRILVEWHNQFETVKQISIQRSFDSLKNFKTILTVNDPTLPDNGYMDTKATNQHMFYRLYIQLDKGAYLFSDTKKPVFDTLVPKNMTGMIKTDNPSLIQSITTDIGGPAINTPVINKPKTETWVPSKYVYTLKDGYIKITLPEDSTKKYDIKFFTLRDEFMFELKDIKEKSFKIDKANFYQSGWFKFELYENGEVKEKNRFYLPKEF